MEIYLQKKRTRLHGLRDMEQLLLWWVIVCHVHAEMSKRTNGIMVESQRLALYISMRMLHPLKTNNTLCFIQTYTFIYLTNEEQSNGWLWMVLEMSKRTNGIMVGSPRLALHIGMHMIHAFKITLWFIYTHLQISCTLAKV